MNRRLIARFSLYVDDRVSFEVGCYLLKQTNKRTKNNNNKKHQHHHEQKYQEPQRETVSQENCYPVKSTHCSMFLLEEFSCTCSEQSQQYWSIWCLLGCLVPMISAQDGGFYSSGFVHSAPYHCAHFSSQQLSTIGKALVYVVLVFFVVVVFCSFVCLF